LGDAQSQDGLAQHPQARGLQFQSDDEHEQDDPEIRDLLGGIEFADQAQTAGTDDDASGQIAEHRS